MHGRLDHELIERASCIRQYHVSCRARRASRAREQPSTPLGFAHQIPSAKMSSVRQFAVAALVSGRPNSGSPVDVWLGWPSLYRSDLTSADVRGDSEFTACSLHPRVRFAHLITGCGSVSPVGCRGQGVSEPPNFLMCSVSACCSESFVVSERTNHRLGNSSEVPGRTQSGRSRPLDALETLAVGFVSSRPRSDRSAQWLF